MYAQFRKILDLLSLRERRTLWLLIPLMLGGAIIDSLGVASIMPFIAVLSNPGVVESNPYLKWVFNAMAFSSEREFMRFLALVFFFLLVLTILYKGLSTYVLTRFSQMREYSIGHTLVQRYLGQPYDWFLSQHSADLGKSILIEVSRVVGSVIIPLLQLFVQGAIVVALLALLLFVQPEIAVIIGATLIVAYATIYLLQRSYLRRLGVEIERANQSRFRVISEAFSGIKSVKVAGLEGHYASRFAQPAYDYAKHIAASNVATLVPRFSLELLAFGGMLGVIFFLLRDYSSFQSMLPVLSVYALAAYRLMPAMQQVYLAISTLRVSGPTLEKLHAEFVALQPVRTSISGRPFDCKSEIRLESISYRYPESSKMNLHQIDMTIPARTSIGIVGATGSGKTTTIDIILGLLQPAQGRLVVDGREVNQETRADWQRLIGYVPQQIFLTDDTIAANIAYGVPSQLIDHQAVMEAAKIANLDDFVVTELAQGYQTMVGERGVRLSGGQIQRIGIARALYKKPRLLVLDEATSALDNLTESAVMDAIANLGHQITMVTIAHRISTVRDCDCIYVLEQGRIADQGSYDELVARSGRFQDMVNSIRPQESPAHKV